MKKLIGRLRYYGHLLRICTLSQEQHRAVDAYWSARTPEQERIAYQRMKAVGFPPAYGE